MTDLAYRIIKYVLFAAILVCLLKYLPENSFDIQTIVTIIIIIVGSQFLLDFICESRKPQECKCENENFEQVNDTKNPYNTVKDKMAGKTDTKQDTKQDTKIDTMNLKVETTSEPAENNIQNDRSENDMSYSQIGYDRYDPMGQLNNPNRRKFRDPKYRGEYGDWYIPPEEWYPPCVKPPVCVTNNGCPVQPVYTSGNYADLREFDNTRKVTQENISIPFVKMKDGQTMPATNKDANNDIAARQQSLRNKEKSNVGKAANTNLDFAGTGTFE